MSLRDFHILFITTSVILLLGFTYWGFTQYKQLHELLYAGTSLLSLSAAVGLGIYEVTFIKKTKA